MVPRPIIEHSESTEDSVELSWHMSAAECHTYFLSANNFREKIVRPLFLGRSIICISCCVVYRRRPLQVHSIEATIITCLTFKSHWMQTQLHTGRFRLEHLIFFELVVYSLFSARIYINKSWNSFWLHLLSNAVWFVPNKTVKIWILE